MDISRGIYIGSFIHRLDYKMNGDGLRTHLKDFNFFQRYHSSIFHPPSKTNMQFKTLLLPLLFGFVLASSAERLDAKPVVDALNNISTAIQGLTTSVGKFSGDPVERVQILTQAEALLDVITKANKAINAIDALPLNEAVLVLKPGNALITDTQKVVDILISKKPDFDKNNLSSIVTTTLQNFKTQGISLIAVIRSKLPSNVASVGDTIGKQINAAIDKGLATYT
jgi:Hydrophobic surface binding protein A